MGKLMRAVAAFGFLLVIFACATVQKQVPSAAGPHAGVLTQNEPSGSGFRNASRIDAFVHRKSGGHLGFMDLYLGMTYDQLNDLVSQTPWTYRIKSPNGIREYADSDRFQYRPSNVLDIEPMFKPGPWGKLLLKKTQGGFTPLPHGPVTVTFHDQRLVEMAISSPLCNAADEIKSRIRPWAQQVSAALTHRFGPASHTYLDVAKVSFLMFQPGFDVTLAQWDMGRQRIRLTIGEDRSRSFFDCSIKLQDVNGLAHVVAIPVPKATGDPAALHWVGVCKKSVDRKDWPEVISSASKAISLDAGLVTPYVDRARAYSEMGLFDKAIADCNTALALDPNRAPAYNNRGLAFQGKHQRAEAARDYRRACLLGLNIGCQNYRKLTGKPIDAGVSRQPVSGHPVPGRERADKIRQLIARSVNQFRDKNWDGAIAAASEALALSPGNGVAYLNRSAALSEKHLFAQAIADATQAILQDPNQALAYNNCGYALEASGKTAEALADYKIACRLNGAMGCANFKRLGATP